MRAEDVSGKSAIPVPLLPNRGCVSNVPVTAVGNKEKRQVADKEFKITFRFWSQDRTFWLWGSNFGYEVEPPLRGSFFRRRLEIWTG